MRPGIARALAVLVAGFLPQGCGSGGEEAARPRCPDCDVVLVTFDALAARRLGLFGCEHRTSPSLDAFAGASYVFENAMSQSGTTLFSIASLFTSRLPYTDDVFDARGDGPLAELGGLAPEEVTLAEMLAEHGYATAAVVGWPLAGMALGADHGFESFEQSSARAERAELTAERAVRVLSRLESPDFLWVHFRTPHAPYEPDPASFGEFYSPEPGEPTLMSHSFEEVSAHFARTEPTTPHWIDPYLVAPLEPNRFRRPVAASLVEQLAALYDGNVHDADRAFGELMDFLDRSGRGAKSIVLVAADHGESLGEHAWVGHNTLYRTVLRTPILLRLPTREHAEMTQPVSNLDLVPTVLDMVGVARPENLRGRSLFATRGGDAVRIAETPNGRAVRRGRYKLIERIGTQQGRVELFDLAADPGEEHELADARPELVRELLGSAEVFAARDGPLRALDDADPVLEALRAIGYLDD